MTTGSSGNLLRKTLDVFTCSSADHIPYTDFTCQVLPLKTSFMSGSYLARTLVRVLNIFSKRSQKLLESLCALRGVKYYLVVPPELLEKVSSGRGGGFHVVNNL